MHSEGELQPLKKWFQDTYSKEYLANPQQSAFEFSSMSFPSPYKASKRSEYFSTPRRQLQASSLSPRYLSPIANSSRTAFTTEFVMGCSACGTKAIEGAAWTYHGSPPRMRPSNRPELVDITHENSGAYSTILTCRLHRAYSYLSDAVNMKEIRLLEEKLDAESSPFSVQIESNEATAQTTVVKEVFPGTSVPLTPLNYEEASRLKASLFHNSIAQKYVKEEERLRVATRRAEYANRKKGFTRIVEAVRIKPEGEIEAMGFVGDPVYTTDSLEVMPVPMDTISSSEERKEVPQKLDLEAFTREELMEEGIKSTFLAKSEPVKEGIKDFVGQMKAPLSFRNPQRHNSASIRREKDSTQPKSPTAESEDMTESTGKPVNSDLARKKLEEIRKTVKQNREERKSRDFKQNKQEIGLKGRENRRHPTSGSNKEAVFTPFHEESPLKGKSNSVAGPLSSRGSTPRQSSEIKLLEVRKSAVIGAVRIHLEEQEPRFSDLMRSSSEEEGLVEPQTVPGVHRDEEESRGSEEYQESISPISPLETYVGAGGTVESFLPLQTEEGRDDIVGIGQREGLRCDFDLEDEGIRSIPKGGIAFPGTPHPVPEALPHEEVTPVPDRSRPVPSFQAVSLKSPISMDSPLQAENQPKPFGGTRKRTTSETVHEEKKTASRRDVERENGRPFSSRSPRPATEKSADLAFLGHTGVPIHTGESQFRDSRPSSKGREALSGSDSEAHVAATKPQAATKGKAMPHSVPRKKLSSKPASEISSFHRIQEEAVIIIQRAARQFLARVSRNKACQGNTEQYKRAWEVLELLEDSDVIAGLRMLGGFVEYMEERGLRSL